MNTLIKILGIVLFGLILNSCKQKENDVRDDLFWNPQIVDEPVKLITNVEIIQDNIRKTLSTKTISEFFGAGEQNFPIEIAIDKYGKFNSLQINDFSNPDTKTKVMFLMSNKDFINILKMIECKPAKLRGRPVGSLLYLNLVVTVNPNGVIVVPWTVKELKITKDTFKKKSDDEAFTFVEQMPVYPGGIDALLKFISANIKYPEIARRAGVEGKVIVQFVVDQQGKITHSQILKGLGAGCDEEALRVVKELKNFQPGKQGGKAVKVKMVIPFSFKLE
ncbi:MAG: energy transducer TonB [Ignavibacteriales bacterium]|nr:energy transducer TonB [Ignavibacteriales bacterium]